MNLCWAEFIHKNATFDKLMNGYDSVVLFGLVKVEPPTHINSEKWFFFFETPEKNRTLSLHVRPMSVFSFWNRKQRLDLSNGVIAVNSKEKKINKFPIEKFL